MRINNLLKSALVALALALTASTAMAKPAKPGIRQYTQADGTSVNLRLVGDEFHSVYMSEDNYPVVYDNGIFYFAELSDDKDDITASKWRVADMADRSADLTAWLAKQDLASMTEVLSAKGASTRQVGRRNALGLFPGASFPVTGSPKVVVILVQFSDESFYLDNPKDYFHRMLNQKGFSDYYGTGSALDFFTESSMGKFTPQFDVYGPVTLPNPMSYYGAESGASSDVRPSQMVIDACRQLDSEINYADYDDDNNGTVDNIYIFYAGKGQATYGGPETIWPHQGQVWTTLVLDGKRISRYACSNEWEGTSPTAGHPDGPGTFCHEFCHVMGLPDLYATSYPTPAPFTPGEWSTMDIGPYNNYGFTPPTLSAFERYALGWLEPIELKANTNVKLEHILSSNSAYIIKTASQNEFYLLENRQEKGWDRYLPGHGMLVWHINYDASKWVSNVVNNTASDQRVDIVEADNILTDGTRSGDSFPGAAGVTSFTDDTAPSMKTAGGSRLNLPITEIAESAPEGLITFKVSGGAAPATATVVKAATNVTPRSFTAEWKEVSSAKEYRLYVATATGEYVPGYEGRNVGTKTKFDVTGLNPSTQYKYFVVVNTATSSSARSNEITLTTGALTHEYVLPTALDATNRTETSFTANWEAVSGADGYEIDVYSRVLSGTSRLEEGFDSKSTDWFNNSGVFYSSALYSGNSSPSLKLTDKLFISSPLLAGDIRKLSFYNRSRNVSDASRLIVEVYVDDCWMPIATFKPETSKSTTTLNTIPAGARAVKITVSDPSDKLITYVDDISITYGGTERRNFINGYNGASTGNVTSIAVNGLESGSDYLYGIRALKGGIKSMTSELMAVRTTGMSGIDAVLTDAAGVVSVDGQNIVICSDASVATVTTLSGQLLYSGSGIARIAVSPGIYLVTAGGTTTKVIVR